MPVKYYVCVFIILHRCAINSNNNNNNDKIINGLFLIRGKRDYVGFYLITFSKKGIDDNFPRKILYIFGVNFKVQ